jgi:hypothetical protein
MNFILSISSLEMGFVFDLFFILTKVYIKNPIKINPAIIRMFCGRNRKLIISMLILWEKKYLSFGFHLDNTSCQIGAWNTIVLCRISGINPFLETQQALL